MDTAHQRHFLSIDVGKEVLRCWFRFPVDALTVTQGVFEMLWEKLDPGETAKIIGQLPGPLRTLWPQIARQA